MKMTPFLSHWEEQRHLLVWVGLGRDRSFGDRIPIGKLVNIPIGKLVNIRKFQKILASNIFSTTFVLLVDGYKHNLIDLLLID